MNGDREYKAGAITDYDYKQLLVYLGFEKDIHSYLRVPKIYVPYLKMEVLRLHYKVYSPNPWSE